MSLWSIGVLCGGILIPQRVLSRELCKAPERARSARISRVSCAQAWGWRGGERTLDCNLLRLAALALESGASHNMCHVRRVNKHCDAVCAKLGELGMSLD
eukprot:4086900-Amphidinium_carterae.2